MSLYPGRMVWVSLMHWQPQSYVMQLASIPRKELDDANVRLAVIGCGSWDVIPSYRGEYRSRCRHVELTRRVYPHQEITGFNGEVYADPSRSTFRALELISGLNGLTLTPSGHTKRSYVANNTPWSSIQNFFVGHRSGVVME